MKRDFVLAFCFVILGGVMLLPLLIVSLGEGEGSAFQQITSGLREYDSVVLSIGTIALISGLTLLSTRMGNNNNRQLAILSNKSQEKVAKNNADSQLVSGQVALKIAKEIKLSEFRQVWINEMREDMAEYVSLLAKPLEEVASDREVVLTTRIYLRLNHDEDLSKEMGKHVLKIEALRKLDDLDALHDAMRAFTDCGQRILKTEWAELKRRLDLAMRFSEPAP
jgi:hypothetical protein